MSYFSSTGNTLFSVLFMKDIFESYGHIVNLFEVINEGSAFLHNADMYGIVYPVWASSLPDPYLDIIAGMPDGNKTQFFLVGVCSVFTGDTGMFWKKRIEKHGYDVFYIDHIMLPINVNIPGFNVWKVPDEKKKARMFETARDKLRKICGSIVRGTRKSDGIGPLARLGGVSQRAFYWMLQSWKDMLRIDQVRCIKCRLCERMCPVDNIRIDNIDADIIHIKNNNGESISVYNINMNKIGGTEKDRCFGSRCIFCLKCYNLCPQNAVLIGERSSDIKKYKRYKGPSADFKPILYR